jgi:signal transduction histidine kinase
MRLATYITTEMECILVEWEAFAATQLPAADIMNSLALRDHAKQILGDIAADVMAPQTDEEQKEKSHGQAFHAVNALKTAARVHAVLRAKSGFSINQMVAEYRALRATVLRLWANATRPSAQGLLDSIRFNEALDQALAESVSAFSAEVGQARKLLAAMVGHDMRSPLQTILMVSAMLPKLNAGEKVTAAAQRLTNSGRQLQGLLDDLLDFNRVQLGLTMSTALSLIDLNTVVEDQVQQQRSASPDRQITWRSTGVAKGLFDSKRLHQLSGNLISNALKYGKRDEPVQVALEATGDQAVLTVKNSGPAIDPSVLSKIFEPLQRGVENEKTDEPDSSMGLGLFIAREIASAHGGAIEVRSDASETVFTVHLPLKPVDAAAGQLAAPSEAS